MVAFSKTTICTRVGLETTRGLVAVEDWHLHVHEDQIRAMVRRRNQPCLAVFGLDNIQIGAGEQIPQDLPVVF
jgi:hypothetical protein